MQDRGSRGTGLGTSGLKLWARTLLWTIYDVFEGNLEGNLLSLSQQHSTNGA